MRIADWLTNARRFGPLRNTLFGHDSFRRNLRRPGLQVRNNSAQVLEERILLFQFQDSARWDSTATNGPGLVQGDGTTLTWNVVADGTPVSGGVGEAANPSDLIARMDAIYGTASGPLTNRPWFPIFQGIVNRWGNLSGLNYVYETADDGAKIDGSTAFPGVLGVRADVRISGHGIDGDSGTLAYNYFPNVSSGDMVIDTADNSFTNLANNSLFLRNVMAHELGHGLGINHNGPVNQTKLLEPTASTAFDGPQFDDVLAVHRGYGDKNEDGAGNNTFTTATNLGSLPDGAGVVGANASGVSVLPTQVDFVSIDDDSDADYFKIIVPPARKIDVTLTPVGPGYQNAVQNSSAPGGFDPPTSFNAAAQSDLTLRVLGGDGSTILASANAGGLGQSESLVGVFLTGGGTFYLQVSGTQNAVQMYRLNYNLILAPTPPVADIVDIAADPRNNAVGTVTINFNEPVTGVDIADFQLTRNGSPVNIAGLTVTESTSSRYTINLTSVTSLEGTYSLTLVAAGADIRDPDGTLMTTNATDSWVNDQTLPTADIVNVAMDPRGSAISTIVVNFSEAVTGVTVSDFTLTRNGTAVALSGVTITQLAPNQYRLGNLTSKTGSAGNYVLSLAAAGSGIADLATNTLGGSVSDDWIVDLNPPVADIVNVTPDPRDTTAGIVTINFNKHVSGVDISDFKLTLDGATVSLAGLAVSPTSGLANTYTLDLSSVTNGLGTYILQLLSTGTGIADDGSIAMVVGATDSWLKGINLTPVDVTLSNNSVPENSNTAAPLTVGTLVPVELDFGIGAITFSIAGGADAGSFQVAGNQLQFKAGTVLDFEAKNSYSVMVTAQDAPGSVTRSFTVNLSDVNEAPTNILLSGVSVAENTATPAIVGAVNVIDDALGTNVVSISGVDAANFDLSGGNLRFKAGATLNHEAKSSYQITLNTTDGPLTFSKPFTILVTNVEEPPQPVTDVMQLAEGGTATVLVGGATSVLANDSDPEQSASTLILSLVNNVTRGTLTLNPNGTFQYFHDGSENLTDSFTYRVTDVTGQSATATVNINMSPVNDNNPVSVTDSLIVVEGAQATVLTGGGVNLLANDFDLDQPFDVLTIDVTPVTPPAHGTVTIFANGTFRYVHSGDESPTDQFRYLMRDAAGRSTVGIVNVNVTPVNDIPIPRPDAIEVPEGGTATQLLTGATSVLANDSDAETLPAGMTLTVQTAPTRGTLILNPNGTFSYQHDGSETRSDSFVYRLADPSGDSALATVTIRITPVNDNTPVAVNDYAEVVQGGSINVLFGGAVSVAKNDTDADLPFDAFTVTLMTGPTNGSLSLAADGSFIYTHNGTKTPASDSFTYKLTDALGHVSSNTGTVNISVKLINAKPIAHAGGPYLLSPGTDLNLNGSGTIDPDGDGLTYRWDIKGDGIVDVTTNSPTSTVPWATLVSLGLTSGVTSVKLEVRDSSGLSSSSSTTLQIGSTYEFKPTADGNPDDYVVSTINGALDIRRVGSAVKLAPEGLTAITSVNIVGSSDDETFLIQSPSRTLSFTVDGNDGTDVVKVQGTAQADTLNVSSPSGRIVVAKSTGVPFYVSATSETVVVLGSDGADKLDARQVLAALTTLQLLGENGNDTLTGGLGNDSFVGGDGVDLLSEFGPGNLTLTNSQLIGHGSDVIDTTIEAIKLTGDAGANQLDASAFTRFGVHLDGAAGNDTLLGGSNTDSLVGGDGIDEVRQSVGGNATLSNTLLVLGTAPNTVSDGLSSIEKAKLIGSGTVNKLDATNFSGSATLDGGAQNDTLIGGSGADLILGGADNDSLLGNGGNDTIGGGTGNDIIDGGDGNDLLGGQGGNDTFKGGD